MVDLAPAPEAVELGATVHRVLDAAGGLDLARAAEADPGPVVADLERRLGDLGLWALKPAADEVQLQAAAAACRAAGRVALPYPVAARLSAQAGGDGDAIALCTPDGWADLVDDRRRWTSLTPDGLLHDASPDRAPAGSRLGPFVVHCTLTDPRPAPDSLLATGLVLGAHSLLGLLDRAFELTREHTRTRAQFGRPLIEFQGVQYQLADALVAIQRVEALADHALWSLATAPGSTLVDAIGLRSTLLDGADLVFRVAHQLHGASGFCDETPVSLLSRHSQPLRRLPTSGPATDAWLARLVTRDGLTGLFSVDHR